MQGNIDFSGTLSGSIAGGGSGGSDVTITPTLQSGTKIADFSIDSESGSLYAPTPEGLTAELPLIISNNTISIDLSNYQEKLIAGSYINIDSNNEISCTPPITNVWYTPEAGVQQDILIGKFTVNEVTQNVYAPSGSSWDYSTSEVDTGQKWIDGKNLFSRVITINEQSEVTSNSYDLSNIGIETAFIDKAIIQVGAIENYKWITAPYFASTGYYLDCSIIGDNLLVIVSNGWKYVGAKIAILYTKSA